MKFGSPISGGVPFRDPRAGGIGAECPGSQCSLWLASILQVALPPHHEGVLGDEGVGWGNLPRLLGDFTPLFLFNGLFGRQGVLLLRLGFLQLGLIEAGDFPHVRLVCHFLTTHGFSFRARTPGTPTRVAAARDPVNHSYLTFLNFIQKSPDF